MLMHHWTGVNRDIEHIVKHITQAPNHKQPCYSLQGNVQQIQQQQQILEQRPEGQIMILLLQKQESV